MCSLGVVMNSSDKELASLLLTSLCGPLEGQLCVRHSIFISLMDKLRVEAFKRSQACFVFLNKMFVSVSLPRVMSTGKGPEGILKGCPVKPPSHTPTFHPAPSSED